jgi:hypothetical protein
VTRSAGDSTTALTDAALLLKRVLKDGSLQGQAGPSVATEFGILLPDSTGSSGLGASLAGIVSQRGNGAPSILICKPRSRAIIMPTSSSAPSSKVRRTGKSGLSKVFYENEFGKAQTISGLIGLI